MLFIILIFKAFADGCWLQLRLTMYYSYNLNALMVQKNTKQKILILQCFDFYIIVIHNKKILFAKIFRWLTFWRLFVYHIYNTKRPKVIVEVANIHVSGFGISNVTSCNFFE
jgi:hypothetical protein